MHVLLSYFSLSLLSLLARRTDGLGVTFEKPFPGGTYSPEAFAVTWVDGGGSPDMSELDTYTLQLIVGGNTPSDSKVLTTIGSPNSSVATGSTSGDIDPNSAQSIQNGFYLIMTSNTTKGAQVINYSDRFTLINMNGTTPSEYVSAASKQAGSPTNVPIAQENNIAPPPQTSSTPISSATPSAISPVVSATVSEAGSGESGLSDAALTGLIAGAVFALIGFVSLIIWAYVLGKKIRRKRQANLSGALDESKPSRRSRAAFVDGKAELPGNSIVPAEMGHSPTELSPYPSELSAYHERFEAPGWSKAVEAPGSDSVYELEGEWSGWEAGSGRRSQAYDPTR